MISLLMWCLWNNFQHIWKQWFKETRHIGLPCCEFRNNVFKEVNQRESVCAFFGDGVEPVYDQSCIKRQYDSHMLWMSNCSDD